MTVMIIIALVLNIWTGVMTSRLPDDVKFKSKDTVQIDCYSFHYDKSYSPFPASFTIHFFARGRNVTLDLKRNDLVHAPSIPVYTKHGKLPMTSQSMLGYYQDVGNIASIEIECEESCQRYHVLGSIILDNEHFILQKKSGLDDLDGSYELLQSHAVTEYGSDYSMSGTGMKTQWQDFTKRYKRATGTYTVELLLVIDYSIYKFWYDQNSQITNLVDRRRAGINNIKQYYGFFMNGMDLRYQNLPGASFQIKVVFAGIYISESANDSPYTVADVNNIVDAVRTLNDFSTWVNSNSAILPSHDHAMMFTRYDIAKGGSTSTKGYAFTGTMCSIRAHSIVEDDFDFIVQTTGAHELGHGLNALHDGDSNSCDGSAGFIMASVAQVFGPTDSRRRNPWIFSSCSVSYINNYLDSLRPNCLLNQDSSDTTGLNGFTATPIGQSYSPDEQCVYRFGSGSYFGRTFYNSSTLSSICTIMYCKDPASTNLFKAMIPGYGTSCGNKKWCDAGQCVSSSSASALSDSCPFGDSPDNAVEKGCSAFIKQNPWNCYNDNSFSICCSSCNAIKTSTQGCEFGDKTDCSVITSGLSCYNNNTETLCCSTCKKFDTGRADCKYGDRANCASLTAPGCYSNEVQCCDHCYKYQTGIPNCKFGDRASDCSASLCTLNAGICCQSCYTGTTTRPTTKITQATSVQTAVKTDTTKAITVGVTTLPVSSTTQSTGFLSNWVLPVAAAGSSVLVIMVLIMVFFCWKRQSKSKPTTSRSSVRKQQLSYIKHTSHSGPYVVYDNPIMQPQQNQQGKTRVSNGNISKQTKPKQGFTNPGFMGI